VFVERYALECESFPVENIEGACDAERKLDLIDGLHEYSNEEKLPCPEPCT